MSASTSASAAASVSQSRPAVFSDLQITFGCSDAILAPGSKGTGFIGGAPLSRQTSPASKRESSRKSHKRALSVHPGFATLSII
ncbi:hypothetical protein BDN72DRAFT_897520 [Pluteus cervinus]|uniref:Uncharacterized protein n=1 Tax=Pluteus cervinus TaxID=181527 RepID=A0ACD3AUV9_9AGAR|nr:hypothetical protein BDN72DRAFT_897520 [Pluteus cervinus]